MRRFRDRLGEVAMQMEAIGAGELTLELKPSLKNFLDDTDNEDTKKSIEAVSENLTFSGIH